MDEKTTEKIIRIDENVKILLKILPAVQKLEQESAINKREHKIAMWAVSLMSTPALLWVCKKLGIPYF